MTVGNRSVAWKVIAGCVLACAATGSYGVVLLTQDAGASTSGWPPAGTQVTILGLAGLLVTQIAQMLRESRNRKWDLADRAAARADAAAKAEQLRLETAAAAAQLRREQQAHAEAQRIATIQTAIELAKVSKVNRDRLIAAVAENTTLTETHAKAAREKLDALLDKQGCNVTLDDIAAAVSETQETVDATQRKVDEAKTVATDTNVKVTELKEQLEDKDGPA